MLLYASYVNILEGNIETIKTNTVTLVEGGKEDGPEENAEKMQVYVGVTPSECRPKS
jgi:hypothetical protein